MNCNNYLLKMLKQMNDAFLGQDTELLDTVFEIEGKKLYADKIRLSLASSTFKSMLSDRWNSKNEPIEIETYKFDDFKEFLSFIYSGECNITVSNVLTMLDMAEFYQIGELKELCDKQLTKMECNFGNVIELMEMSNKYSLFQIKQTCQTFISQNFPDFIKLESFLNADKSIMNELVNLDARHIKWEEKFQAVYEWSAYQATKKQKESIEENFNMNDAIKAEITPFLRYIQFKEMKLDFLIKYVLKRGFLFSYDELSDIMDYANSVCTVMVTNSNGKILTGRLPKDSNAVAAIESLKNRKSDNGGYFLMVWEKSFNIPSTPSPLKKRNDVEWYLFYFSSGEIGVWRSSDIDDTYYLIAEMSSENGDFEVTTQCEINIV